MGGNWWDDAAHAEAYEAESDFDPREDAIPDPRELATLSAWDTRPATNTSTEVPF
ncbi:hypothetical protein [Kineosporia sp. NBRC 101731]|uniref:hypothetical protein n=1 Tax=Kineosporia sp. NBRC 101731 TaxID=3032199 RepID=UPI0024A197D0|nr:hypothetical protein [Kineosporia sp. NBRC 101731]GLY32023.1 hypothetical protein Kisp02_53880 [Kineosporia sp. NBRC 101731]